MRFWESTGMASRTPARRLPIGRRGCAAIAVAAAALAGVALFSGLFTVVEVRFHGCQSVPPDTLAAVRAALVGRNMLTISTERSRARLLACGEVADAVFKRRPFHAVECFIAKRVPVALLVAGNVREVDALGAVIPRRAGTGDVDLPVITGIGERAIAGGGRKGVGRAVEVLRLFREAGFSPAEQLSEIHVEGEDVDLVWMGTGTLIRLGREEYANRIRKLRAVYSVLDGRDPFPELIDLRFDRQVIIR